MMAKPLHVILTLFELGPVRCFLFIYYSSETWNDALYSDVFCRPASLFMIMVLISMISFLILVNCWDLCEFKKLFNDCSHIW